MSPRKLDGWRGEDDRPHLELVPNMPPIEDVTDDDIRHELVDWSLVLKDENGDLPRDSWDKIDELLDEAHRRRLEFFDGKPHEAATEGA